MGIGSSLGINSYRMKEEKVSFEFLSVVKARVVVIGFLPYKWNSLGSFF